MKSPLVFVCAALLITCLTGSLAGAFPSYYDISEHDKAQAEARQRNLPLAWLGSFPESLTVGSPEPGSINDLTQMALATLQDHAVVIFFDCRNMTPVPAIIHAQYHIQDDGPLPNGANWISPKVVFSGVCRLSAGTAARVASNGTPTCFSDLGRASGPSAGIGGVGGDCASAVSCQFQLDPLMLW